MSGSSGRHRRKAGCSKISFSFSPRNVSPETAGKEGGASFSFSLFFVFLVLLVIDLELRIHPPFPFLKSLYIEEHECDSNAVLFQVRYGNIVFFDIFRC